MHRRRWTSSHTTAVTAQLLGTGQSSLGMFWGHLHKLTPRQVLANQWLDSALFRVPTFPESEFSEMSNRDAFVETVPRDCADIS